MLAEKGSVELLTVWDDASNSQGYIQIRDFNIVRRPPAQGVKQARTHLVDTGVDSVMFEGVLLIIGELFSSRVVSCEWIAFVLCSI